MYENKKRRIRFMKGLDYQTKRGGGDDRRPPSEQPLSIHEILKRRINLKRQFPTIFKFFMSPAFKVEIGHRTKGGSSDNSTSRLF